MRRVQGQVSRVEGRRRHAALRSNSGPRPSTLDPRPLRRGVTLVELLITILIISILAALVLGVAAVAGETAREAQTRNTISRLHTLLTEHYNTYQTRRVRLVSDVEQRINQTFARNATARGRALAEARLYALREMMLMEVPDRWSDVLLNSVGQNAQIPLYLESRTDLANVYLRRYQSLIGRTNALTGEANTIEELQRNQGAECLYMIITIACGDGEARSLFHESDIGDSDGDGAPEFLDGWGRPINFLRWAPGFDSPIQLNMNTLLDMDADEANRAVARDHDPFDIFRAELKAFRLVPLIYSPGRDEDSGLYVSNNYVTWRPSNAPLRVNNTNIPPFVEPRLTPYELNGLLGYLGTDHSMVDTSVERTLTDNIHNHLLGQR